MRPEPVIIGCVAETSLGDLDHTWQRLLTGSSGLRPWGGDGPLAHYPVGKISGLDSAPGSSNRLRQLLAQAWSSVSPDLIPRDGLHTIIATTKAAVDELLEEGDHMTGHPLKLGDLFQGITGTQGHVGIVSAACASGTIALIKAAAHIAGGGSEPVLVVGIDILSRFVLAGFAGLQALSSDGCRPFDQMRNGLSLGEGVAIMVVSSREWAERHAVAIKAVIDGWGISCDSVHITAPCRHGSGLRRVLDLALGENKNRVGAINAHGTGTDYNDAMELTAFTSFWQTDPPPIHSIKGAVGHCLGGAGLIEAAIAVQSLRQEIIPPTVGCQQPENCKIPISNRPQPLTLPTVFSCNSGFGGINAGVLLKNPQYRE